MSLLYESKDCYSNVCHYYDETDTFASSQARQVSAFVNELIRQQWIACGEQAAAAKAQPTPMSVVKEKADNLLRMTKTRAIRRLKGVA